MQIVRQIDDVNFAIMDEVKGDMVHLRPCHGTILMIKGIVEDEPEKVVPFGIPDGETEARVAFYEEDK